MATLGGPAVPGRPGSVFLGYVTRLRGFRTDGVMIQAEVVTDAHLMEFSTDPARLRMQECAAMVEAMRSRWGVTSHIEMIDLGKQVLHTSAGSTTYEASAYTFERAGLPEIQLRKEVPA